MILSVAIVGISQTVNLTKRLGEVLQMDSSKYTRMIEMQCPTCAGSHFSFEGDSEDELAIVTCAACGRRMTRAELRESNSENIEAHAKEIGKQAAQDIADELRKTLKNAFKGSKNITIK